MTFEKKTDWKDIFFQLSALNIYHNLRGFNQPPPPYKPTQRFLGTFNHHQNHAQRPSMAPLHLKGSCYSYGLVFATWRGRRSLFSWVPLHVIKCLEHVYIYMYTPLKFNMEPEIFNPFLKRRFLLETIIFRFHMNLWECIYIYIYFSKICVS